MSTISGSRPTPPEADTGQESQQPTTHPFTCNPCQVAFRTSDLQKEHMKGEWHRYNLQRRVVGLAPISSDLFHEKVLQTRATTTAQANKARFEQVCQVCRKTYYSENSFQNHLSSQKHKAKEAAGAQKSEVAAAEETASSMMSSTFSLGEPQKVSKPEVDLDAEEEFTQVVEGLKKASIQEREGTSPVKRPTNPQAKEKYPLSPVSGESQSEASTPIPTQGSAPAPSLKLCLFCNYNSPTIALNVAHMVRFHDLFLPERQYLVDMEGLVATLEKRIREDHQCLFCHKVKANVFAVQTHMRDKGHCMIPYTTIEEQLEIGDFYDFRATYSDSESDEEMGEDKPAGGAKLGAKRSANLAVVDGDGDAAMEVDDGWETDSSASSLDSDDLHAVPAENHYHQYERLDKHPHHTQTDPRAHHQRDGWHSHAHKHNHAVFYDEYELHLPSGKSVGHRSFQRYFRQNLRDYPTAEEREERAQLAITEGDDAMDVNGASVVSTNGSRVRDAAAHARGRADNTWTALTRHGEGGAFVDRGALSTHKAVERMVARDQATQQSISFKFGGKSTSARKNKGISY